MFAKITIAFSTLLALASAGGYAHDTAAVAVKQNDHAFSYKVSEANHLAYAAPVVHHGYAAAYPAAHGYHGYAHAAPAVVAHKAYGYAAPIVHHQPVVYHHAPKPYAFGYSYGAASPVYGYAKPHSYHQHGW